LVASNRGNAAQAIKTPAVPRVVEAGRSLAIDCLDESEPLLMAVALGDAGDQLTLEIVECGE
jgi:hypothetical protein